MSLKAFHIVFITSATLLALGVGAWALWQYWSIGGWSYAVGAGGSFVSAASLVCYGRYFLKKLKDVSYL
jgi:hypothetical protein